MLITPLSFCLQRFSLPGSCPASRLACPSSPLLTPPKFVTEATFSFRVMTMVSRIYIQGIRTLLMLMLLDMVRSILS